MATDAVVAKALRFAFQQQLASTAALSTMWQCPACGAAITFERRSAHRKHWCPALDDNNDDALAPEASRTPAAAAPSLSFATAPASTSTTHARVASIGLDLEFACQSIFGAVLSLGAASLPRQE